MKKSISLSEFANSLMFRAQLGDFCRINGIGTTMRNGETYYNIMVEYQNGSKGNLLIPCYEKQE